MLDFEMTLHLDEREDVVQQRIDDYFVQQRYQTRYNNRGDIYYERGEAWRNYIAMSPAGWHVFASVKPFATSDGVNVVVQLNVDTQGQMVLGREHSYWEAEFEALTAYLTTGKNKHGDAVGQLGHYNWRHNVYLTVAILLVFILGLMAFQAYSSASCYC